VLGSAALVGQAQSYEVFYRATAIESLCARTLNRPEPPLTLEQR
jgi:hypothetical protein